YRTDAYKDALKNAGAHFEVACPVTVIVNDDVAGALRFVKLSLSFYIGGMGAASKNFHLDVVSRMGFESEAANVQELFLSGRRDEAVDAVPDALADEISLVGPAGRIKERLAAWEESPVTTLLVGSRDRDTLRLLTELI